MVKIQLLLLPYSKDKRFRKTITSLRWCLFTKNEVKALQRRLEARKSTLCGALDAVTAYEPLPSVHPPSMDDTNGVKIV